MGTWGAGLYEGDAALDVRGAYLDFLGNGLSGPEATQRLLDGDYGFYDPETYVYDTVPWLALADTQWRVGRLEERVKTQALAAINSGRDLVGWDGSPKQTERRRVLSALRRRLLAPQPPEKAIRRRYIQEAGFDVGDLVAYRLLSGQMTLFRVIEHHRWPNDDVTPLVEFLDWAGDAVPPFEELVRLEPRPPAHRGRFFFSSRVYIFRATRRDFPSQRLRLVERGLLVPPRSAHEVAHGTVWKELDQDLREAYGLE